MIENSTDKKFIEMDERNNPLMSLKTLKFYCEKQSLPSDPALNDVLYLQYKGFQRIIPQTISQYINLKTLHLNNNGLRKIEGLHMLRELNNLYLNNNYIQTIQGLQELYNLKVLNLAHNKIDHVQGLDKLENLKTLNLSENFLTKSKDIEGLIVLANLNELNLSQNQLEASQQTFQTITELQNITVLYLKNTPLCNTFKNYRKRLIYKLKKLKFLDNRPVLHSDHKLAEAWIEGGAQKQTQLKSKLIDTKKQEEQKQLEDQTKKVQEKYKDKNQKLSSISPILYESSDRSDNDTGLNCAYLPKKTTKLQKFFECDFAQKPVNINKKVDEKIEHEEIRQKVQQVFSSQKSIQELEQRDVKLNQSINKKWNKKYEKLLQELLLKYKFDFSEAQPSFNMILSNIKKKLMKPSVRFQIDELRRIWTDVEKSRRAEQQRILSEKSILLSNPQKNINESLMIR